MSEPVAGTLAPVASVRVGRAQSTGLPQGTVGASTTVEA